MNRGKLISILIAALFAARAFPLEVEIGRYPTGLGAKAISLGCIEAVLTGPSSVHGNPAGLVTVKNISMTGTTEFDGPGKGFLRRRLADRSPVFVENIGRRHLKEPFQHIALKVPKLIFSIGTQQTYVIWARTDSPVYYPFTQRQWGTQVNEYEVISSENTVAVAFGSQTASFGIAVSIPQLWGRYNRSTYYLPNDPLEATDNLSVGDGWSSSSVGAKIGVQKENKHSFGNVRWGAFFEKSRQAQFEGTPEFPAGFTPPFRLGLGMFATTISNKLSIAIEGDFIAYGTMAISSISKDVFDDVLQFKTGFEYHTFSFLPVRLGLARLGPARNGQTDLIAMTYGTSLSFNKITGLSSTVYFKEFFFDFAGTFSLLDNSPPASSSDHYTNRADYSSGTSYFATVSIIF